jgi:hypothetical protein
MGAGASAVCEPHVLMEIVTQQDKPQDVSDVSHQSINNFMIQ